MQLVDILHAMIARTIFTWRDLVKYFASYRNRSGRGQFVRHPANQNAEDAGPEGKPKPRNPIPPDHNGKRTGIGFGDGT
jgi:hypothetical protein